MKICKPSDAFKLLNGVFCVYKPSQMNMKTVQDLLKRYLTKDLNDLEKRPMQYFHKPIIAEDPQTGDMITVGHEKSLDYSRHPLVLGNLYEEADLEIVPVYDMDYDSNGICLMAVNDGCDEIKKIRKARHLSVYHLSGRFGRATLDYSESGKIMNKTTFKHITEDKINKIGRSIISNYQKLSFEHAGVHIQTQEAFELAAKGLIRPKEDSAMIVYDLKCVDLKLPYFTIELHTINESHDLIKNFIANFGTNLRSSACYTKLLKIRQGNFTSDHALLIKHWTLENILNGISQCKILLEPKMLKVSQTLGQNRMQNISNDPKTKYTEVLFDDFEEDSEQFYEIEEANLDRLQTEGVENRMRLRHTPTVPRLPGKTIGSIEPEKKSPNVPMLDGKRIKKRSV